MASHQTLNLNVSLGSASPCTGRASTGAAAAAPGVGASAAAAAAATVVCDQPACDPSLDKLLDDMSGEISSLHARLEQLRRQLSILRETRPIYVSDRSVGNTQDSQAGKYHYVSNCSGMKSVREFRLCATCASRKQ